MIRLIGVELFKLRTTRIYLWLLTAATGLVVLVTSLHFILAGDSALSIEGAAETIATEADLRSVLDVSRVAAMFTLVLGATALAGEHRHRTIAGTFLITPKRHRVVVAKMIGYAIAGFAFGTVVQAVALTVAVAWLGATGAPIPFGSTVATAVVLAPVATGLATAFGVGIGAVIPNQLGAVLAAVGWVMVVEQLVGGLFPEVAEWLPFTGAGTAIAGVHQQLDPAAGVALFLAYVLTMAAAGMAMTRRRDVD